MRVGKPTASPASRCASAERSGSGLPSPANRRLNMFMKSSRRFLGALPAQRDNAGRLSLFHERIEIHAGLASRSDEAELLTGGAVSSYIGRETLMLGRHTNPSKNALGAAHSAFARFFDSFVPDAR